MDTSAHAHAASNVYCIADPHAASHLDRLTHAYTGHTAPHMDSLSNQNATANFHLHSDLDAHLHSHKYCNPYALEAVLQALA